ncbi:bifunctional alpha,alpha-trehalose-phosphate synthase (UDP-forming)/trehalose-phosphatase [Aggregicoccus sp. 17bor-14]|uniref:bifunctional alpha,alpha-trehalose-phosphate synthase (UDP-forming)/trehalose-phosphatase n=1 Tax=Myxococcaceae TaxID=31 RepID=UPI00129CCE3E|nr:MULTISPECIES: bifunctional alpha,alpha-trehalose-phosphate synthase (UDP-forming)/trehalose-phosphatase [Myxococcaceae]MBF5046587.1 bifunctional alpha,alpha-trehalose-phosphate synthase (UDP-forming)/trehalose-phosphatase [Simulacricoccus sp. 17bor-14]MRI92298.1 bifunctional alpha,alpha-trehalose-phosphate synthase (UDP-forming)/trehalose-phosphatase [Aggregicoccus sp. 17bor-14]
MARLLLVSNRLPVTVKLDRDTVSVVPSAGGLATGLKGPHEQSGGLWIGWPGDVSRLNGAQRAALDVQLRELRCVPLHLSASEVSRFYEGYSNRFLWPLFHYLVERMPNQDRDWEAYRRVNQRFADLAASHYQPGDTIWVHDYQLMLVPGMLRERLPDARIGFFLHIPWPSSEIFHTLPRRAELLRGLLGADLIGFHTLAYVRHFASALLRILGAELSVDRVAYEGREVRLGAFPMGIDAQSFESLSQDPAVQEEARSHREHAGDQRLVLGIDRLDYTKGIPRRMLAVQRLLEREPAWRGRLRFVQVAVPSRTGVEDYAVYREKVDELVGRINGAYGSVDRVPIHYLYRSFTMRQLTALYRAADVLLVTPIRDGMNLVAKEFCAARTDGDGVLVLSEFAGAAAELGEAVQVNPYDVDGMADALQVALEMPEPERRERMQAMRRRVRQNDVHWWARTFLSALEEEPPPRAKSGGPAVEAALARMKAAPHLVLLLDYDGTLKGFAPRPELAAPDAGLRTLLERLVKRPHTSVSLISGRKRETLEEWFGPLPLGLHAEHGLWSRLGPGQPWTMLPDVPTDWKPRVRALLEAFVARVPGSLIEEKTAALAWHYRQVDSQFGAYQARELRLHLAETFAQGPLEVLPGDKVVEVRPRGVNKGRVVGAAVGAAPKGALVVAIGDDRTDEDMFQALPEGSLAIHVGSRPTSAGLRIPDPAAVRALLGRLLD